MLLPVPSSNNNTALMLVTSSSTGNSEDVSSSGQVVVSQGSARQKIPTEVLVEIFKFLAQEDFGSASGVSKDWHMAYQWTLADPGAAKVRLQREFPYYRILPNPADFGRQYQIEICRAANIQNGACTNVTIQDSNLVSSPLLTSKGLLITGSMDGKIIVCDPATGKYLRMLDGHTEVIHEILEISTGQIVSTSFDGTLKVWDPEMSQCLHTLEGNLSLFCKVLKTSTGQIVSASSDHTLKIWDPVTGQCLHTLEGHIDSISHTLETSTGLIVSGANDGTLRVWNPTTGECLHTLDGYVSANTPIIETSTGLIVSGTEDGILRIWNPMTGEYLHLLQGHTSEITQILPTSNGLIVSGAKDGTLKIWNPATGQRIRTLIEQVAHPGIVQILETSTGQIVSGDAYGALKLWDPATAKCLQMVEHGSNISQILEIPTRQIISVADNGTFKIWNLAEGRCLQTIAFIEPRDKFQQIPTEQISDGDTLTFEGIDMRAIIDRGNLQVTPTGQILVQVSSKVIVYDFAASPQQVLMQAARRFFKGEIDRVQEDLNHLPASLRKLVNSRCPADLHPFKKLLAILDLVNDLQRISNDLGLLLPTPLGESAPEVDDIDLDDIELDEKEQLPQALLERLRQAVESDNDEQIRSALEGIQKANPNLLSALYCNLWGVHSDQGLIEKAHIKRRHDIYGKLVFKNTGEASELCKDLSRLKETRLEAIRRTMDPRASNPVPPPPSVAPARPQNGA